MKRLKKNETKGVIYYAAMNPIDNTIHLGQIEKGTQVETGLPVLYTSADKDEVYNMVYESWEMVEEEVQIEKIRVSNIPVDIRPKIKNNRSKKMVCVGVPREFEFTLYSPDEIIDDDVILYGLDGLELTRPDIYKELDDILSEINSTSDFKIVAVDRPGSTDKLLIFSEYSFSKLPAKAQANLLERKEKGDGQRIIKEDLKN